MSDLDYDALPATEARYQECIMCGAPLPPDTRWAIVRWLNPKPPVCRPATEDCYRGLASSLGFTPTDEQVADALARARRVRG